MERQQCPICKSWSSGCVSIPDSLRIDKIDEIRDYLGSIVVFTKDGTRHHLRPDELMIVGLPKQT